VCAPSAAFTGLGFAQGVEAWCRGQRRRPPAWPAPSFARRGATTARASSQTITPAATGTCTTTPLVREVASRQSVLNALAMDDMLHRTVMVGG
jgi:hypothetical protein